MKKIVGGLFLICLTAVGISLLILKAQEETDMNMNDGMMGDSMQASSGQEEIDFSELEELLRKYEERGDMPFGEDQNSAEMGIPTGEMDQMVPEEFSDEAMEQPEQASDQGSMGNDMMMSDQNMMSSDSMPMDMADENKAMMQEKIQP